VSQSSPAPRHGKTEDPLFPGALHRARRFSRKSSKKYFRLAPGREVRLRYLISSVCEGGERREDGGVVELHCTYDPETRNGPPSDGRKVEGVIHWFRPPNPCRRRFVYTTVSFRLPIPWERRMILRSIWTPSRWRLLRRAVWSPVSRLQRRGADFSSRGSAISALTRWSLPPGPRLQPHRDAEGFVGQDRNQRTVGLSEAGRSPVQRRKGARRKGDGGRSFSGSSLE